MNYDTLEIASYVSYRYRRKFEKPIDQMKLHQLLYLLQREYLTRTGDVLFKEAFYGWKYGPVLNSVRKAWRTNYLPPFGTDISSDEIIVNAVTFILDGFGHIESWTLSKMINDYDEPYKNSRKDMKYGESGNRRINLTSMKDASNKIRNMREVMQISVD